MYLLYLETSSNNCSVAISKNEELLCLCEESKSILNHNKKLHSFITYTLEGAKILINDLNAVCVNGGPGSYTGLRIGTAAAKGLCYALSIPLIVINNIEILAKKYSNQSYDYIIIIVEFRGEKIYMSILNSVGKIIKPIYKSIINLDILINFRNKKTLIIGNNLEKFKEFIKINSLNFISTTFLTIFSSAKDMIPLGSKLFQNQKFKSTAYFEPIYLK